MLPAPLKKVLADLWSSKTRSILVALSIAVGVFAVGVIASSFSIVKKDMAADFLAINPHTARIFCQDFDASLLDTLRTVPGVEAIDARYNLWVKAGAANGKQYPINLNSIGPLSAIQVDQLPFEAGSPTLADGEIYLERQGAEGLGIQPGESIDLILNDGQKRTLKMVGTVHDVNANPFKFSSSTAGFVTPDTMADLGGSNRFNFVTFITTGSHNDEKQVREIADRVAAKITESGITVYNVNVTRPGQHPAQSIIDTVLILMGVLSVLVLFLGTFLVTNTISALMGQQIRQIGVMKALGASMVQVTGIYLGLVLSFGIIALLVAVPAAALATYGMTRWLIGMLNATPSAFYIPVESLVLQFFIGLVVPLMGALIPVLSGSRRTIRQAITNYGLEASAKPGAVDRLLETLPWLPRPLILSLRNTFRRKGRLSLTLATLILGGAIFIAMFGVRESLYWEINQTLGYYQADVNVEFTRPYALDEILKAVSGVPGVDRVEGWNIVKANVVKPDGETGDQVFVYAPPAGTKLIKPVLMEGRWLRADDTDAIVVSNHFTSLRPDVKIGDTIQVRLNEKDTPFQVVGIFRMAGTYPSPFTYITEKSMVEMGGAAGMVNNLKIVTDSADSARQNEVMDAVQSRLSEMQFEASLRTGAEISSQQRAQIDILIKLLLAMGLLIAVVGGLGLMGTMGMNILERTREIGVMRSIGAESGVIFQMVIIEGALIGLISWGLSALAAIPITQFLDKALGERLMTVPIVYVFSTQGMMVWLAVALILSALASLLPARGAVRLTIRDVLAYE